MAEAEEKPTEVEYEVTGKCNLNCSYCGCSGCSKRDGGREMETGQAKGALEMLRSLGAERLVFCGGEPLAREDFFEICRHARILGFEIVLETNGLLVRRFIDEIKGAGISEVRFRILGTGQRHDLLMNYSGLFDSIEKSIGLLSGAGIRASVAVSIARFNLGEIEGILSFCSRMNVGGIRASILSSAEEARQAALSEEECREAARILSYYADRNKGVKVIIEKAPGINEGGPIRIRANGEIASSPCPDSMAGMTEQRCPHALWEIPLALGLGKGGSGNRV